MLSRILAVVALPLSLALAACTALPDPDAHASLVAAERAFARYTAEHGVRDGFLKHFAPRGIMFVPAPTAVEDVFAQPAGDPRAVLLEWEPVASGVARSGDFGFTTGPARLSRRDGSAPPRHNTFFSVWKRMGDGPWRVVLDAGVSTPAPVPPAQLLPSPAVRPAAGPDGRVDALLSEERNSAWTGEAFIARLAPDALVQRHGTMPAAGREAIAREWPAEAEFFAPAGGDVARSGDLAYTYGAVQTGNARGHYVHLWTRDATGSAWRIAAALRLP